MERRRRLDGSFGPCARCYGWSLLIISYRGITAIILNETPASRSGTSGTRRRGQRRSAQFPSAPRRGLRHPVRRRVSELQCRHREPACPGAGGLPAQRAQQRQPAAGLGWLGDLPLQSEQVAGITVQDENHAVVDLLASVERRADGARGAHLRCQRRPGGIGRARLARRPAQAAAPTPPTATSDPTAQGELSAQLPAFFQAYGSGTMPLLNHFLAPGRRFPGWVVPSPTRASPICMCRQAGRPGTSRLPSSGSCPG